MLSVFAPWALLPAAAGAAPLQTVQSTASTVAPRVERTAEDVADVARPALDALTTPPDPVTTPSDPVTAPSDPAGEGPIAKTVDPIAHGTGATAPSGAATVPQPYFSEPAKSGVSRIAASASAERSGGRAEREQGSGVVAGSHPSPQRSVTVNGSARQVSSAATVALEAAAAPLAPAPEPSSGPTAGVAASGASAGFFLGGGFALLVAWLLLAGPRLRRGLSMLPVVCRPAAFLVVLERPG